MTPAEVQALVNLDYANWRRRVWVPAAKRVGLEGLGFHDMRRACATYMVLDGLDPKTAQGRLGPLRPEAHAGDLRPGHG